MDRMKDKFVVVTGAAHGIGAAIAQRCIASPTARPKPANASAHC